MVRLMTIHKSKGLGSPWSLARSPPVPSAALAEANPSAPTASWGWAMHYVDETLRTRREPLSYIAIGERERREDAAEELRLLYVLLTRAKRRLFLVGSLRSADARLPLYAAMGACPGAATSHLQWMLGRWKRKSAPGKRRRRAWSSTVWTSLPRPRRNSRARRLRTRWTRRLVRRGSRTRPWPGSTRTCSTANALSSSPPPAFCARRKARAELPTLAERPQFMQEAGMTGAERGSAYHRALQLLELAPLRALDGASLTNAVRAQLDDLRMANRLSETERKAVSPQRLARFFAGGTGRRLLQERNGAARMALQRAHEGGRSLGDAAHAR